MYTIPHAKFVVNAGIAHQLVHADTLIEQEVIVAAIEEPLNGAKFLLRCLVGLLYKTKGAVCLYCLADEVEFVFFSPGPTLLPWLSSHGLMA